MANKYILPADWNDLPVAQLKTLTPNMRRLLREKNLVTCGALARARDETLLGVHGVGAGTVDKMMMRVRLELTSMGYDLRPSTTIKGQEPAPVAVEQEPEAEQAQDSDGGYRWFIEQFVLRRAGTVTGELSGAQAAYEANKAWTRITEMCGDVA